MVRGIVLAGLTVLLVVSTAVGGRAADIQTQEQNYYNRVTALKAQIAEGWTPAQVLAVMGEPDRRGSRADGSDLVDVWGYRGYEVVVEFRNGLVSNWFFRFME